MEFNLWDLLQNDRTNDPPTPLTSLLGLIPSDPPLNTRESNTTASSSLLARRPILTRWEDPRPPTFGKRIRDVMRRLGSPSEAVLENPRFLAAIHQLCWEYVSLWYGFMIMLCLMCRAHCLTVICAHPEYISVLDLVSWGGKRWEQRCAFTCVCLCV